MNIRNDIYEAKKEVTMIVEMSRALTEHLNLYNQRQSRHRPLQIAVIIINDNDAKWLLQPPYNIITAYMAIDHWVKSSTNSNSSSYSSKSDDACWFPSHLQFLAIFSYFNPSIFDDDGGWAMIQVILPRVM
jgi:hypothetical protein